MIFIDQIGHQINIETTPKRIISVVPSQTELLFDLGLENEVVGITKFCIHPNSWFKNKTRIGGTKTLNINKIKQLKPDLIIANKEENTKQQIEELQQLFPVWTSNIRNLSESLEMIKQIGLITKTNVKAEEIIAKIEQDFKLLTSIKKQSKSTLYFIWREPFMSVGSSTFIHDVMERAGFVNAIETSENYPIVTSEQIKSINPQLILLSSEPYPFKEKHIKEFKMLSKNAQILLVDGELFSWYGSRLTKTVHYLIDLLTKIK
ncbi:MAG TPA: helical backbone metal receptor [Vicingus sp.]|jgi:ABC-type Fe3+-hydroxamate transport system substrate-binding protein|nr:ABC transporter substrate-binding protein [Flavobacteriales bacterium]HRN41655.1 helical backbone metal receptor [Vicingus sp.]HRP59029.1 helical backbone metal receptor [Vicingus sp.]